MISDFYLWRQVSLPNLAILSCALLSHACSRDEMWSCCSAYVLTLGASVHAVWVGVLFTSPSVIGRFISQQHELVLSWEKTRIARPWRMPRIPTSRRPIVSAPICWRGRRRHVSLRLSSLFEDRLHSHILPFLKCLSFSLSCLLIARNGSIILLILCHMFVVQSLAFSFRLSRIRSLTEWCLRSSCI